MATLELIDTFFKLRQQQNSIFLHFSKTFDTIDCNIVLKKLEHYGISEMLIWLMNHLTKKMPICLIQQYNVDTLTISTGVPYYLLSI